MNSNVEQLYNVLDKYKFVEPASPEVQRHIRKIKKAQFKKTLKRTASYSLTFALIGYMYFTIKKLGIGITIVKSAAILAAGSTVAAVSIATGTYYTVKHITVSEPEQEIEIEQIIEQESIVPIKGVSPVKQRAVKKEEPKDSIEVIEKRIGVQPFFAENVENTTAHMVTDKIAEEIARLRGKDYVVNYRSIKDKRSGIILKGSVEFLDGTYTISAKLVDVKSLKLLYYTTETVKSLGEIDEACVRISGKIAGSASLPVVRDD